ncbi:3-isopropylmalate dehydratase small subunit [Marinicella sp. S1101]|nr:3-isopropylmalate dehydratase small subunit [Marinicella marina]MCX7552758.1 3-isopropylmalate dehydratase small subunit [Marinicella marina]
MMYKKIAKHNIQGLCAPMMIDDIDTDIIIPAQHLTQTSQSGFGQHAFARLKKANTDFVLNQKRYQAAKILIAGDNFGCGSSREHAVWAIQELGFEAIIAPSFADIFSNNAKKNGLVLIELSTDTCQQMAQFAEAENLYLSIDLATANVTSKHFNHAFNINPFFQYCITHGSNEVDYLLQHMGQIKAHKTAAVNHSLFIQNGASQ